MYDKVLTIYIVMCGVASSSKSMDVDTDVHADSGFSYYIIRLASSQT